MPKVGPERSSQGRARRTTAEHSHFTGSEEFGRWIDLFTEDGAFHMLGRSSIGYPHREHSLKTVSLRIGAACSNARWGGKGFEDPVATPWLL